MQIVYAYYNNGDETIQRTEKELFHSISKSYEMYHLFLLLLIDLRNQEEKRLDLRKQKRIPTKEDLNPNTRFVDNPFLISIAENNNLLKYLNSHKVSWGNEQEFVRKILSIIRESDLYNEYMSAQESNVESDRKFILKFIEKVIAPIDELYSFFEEQSIYWNDEIEFVISMVIKTIKEYDLSLGTDQPLLPEFKDNEDEEFVKKLFRKSVLNKNEYRELIDKYTKNWDIDRVAFIDIVLMQVALAEITEFENIPVKVTLNEYIEIAKHYSTNKSGVFINGVLDKIVDHLKKEKKVVKVGRGLLDTPDLA